MLLSVSVSVSGSGPLVHGTSLMLPAWLSYGICIGVCTCSVASLGAAPSHAQPVVSSIRALPRYTICYISASHARRRAREMMPPRLHRLAVRADELLLLRRPTPDVVQSVRSVRTRALLQSRPQTPARVECLAATGAPVLLSPSHTVPTRVCLPSYSPASGSACCSPVSERHIARNHLISAFHFRFPLPPRIPVRR